MRTEKRPSPQIRGDTVSLHHMVSPQNGDTLGGPPPTLATPLVGLSTFRSRKRKKFKYFDFIFLLLKARSFPRLKNTKKSAFNENMPYQRKKRSIFRFLFSFFFGFLEMCGVCGMVVGVVLRAADNFSSIHSRSE